MIVRLPDDAALVVSAPEDAGLFTGPSLTTVLSEQMVVSEQIVGGPTTVTGLIVRVVTRPSWPWMTHEPCRVAYVYRASTSVVSPTALWISCAQIFWALLGVDRVRLGHHVIR